MNTAINYGFTPDMTAKETEEQRKARIYKEWAQQRIDEEYGIFRDEEELGTYPDLLSAFNAWRAEVKEYESHHRAERFGKPYKVKPDSWLYDNLMWLYDRLTNTDAEIAEKVMLFASQPILRYEQLNFFKDFKGQEWYEHHNLNTMIEAWKHSDISKSKEQREREDAEYDVMMSVL